MWTEVISLKRLLRGLLLGAGGTALGAAACYRFAISPRLKTWGATPEEVMRPMPGDELVPTPVMFGTRAITIDAPPEDVWPWLVQIGYGRAGFYSYRRMEQLMGLTGIQNADRILPEYQQLELGDIVRFGPGQGAGLPVIAFDRLRHLALGGKQLGGVVTWAFGLYRIDATHTRLVSRNLAFMAGWTYRSILADPARWRTELPMKLFLNLGGFVMVRRMLLGIKQRAEALHAQRQVEDEALALSSGCE